MKNTQSILQTIFARSIGADFYTDDGSWRALPALPAALGAERFKVGGVSCYVAGNGPPMLLVHSVNAAPSAAEVRPIFDHYVATHTVFAVDLPGYGYAKISKTSKAALDKMIHSELLLVKLPLLFCSSQIPRRTDWAEERDNADRLPEKPFKLTTAT